MRQTTKFLVGLLPVEGRTAWIISLLFVSKLSLNFVFWEGQVPWGDKKKCLVSKETQITRRLQKCGLLNRCPKLLIFHTIQLTITSGNITAARSYNIGS